MGLLDSVVPIACSLLVVGLGYSLVSPATNSGVIAVTPTHLRGRMMGVKQMGVTAGGAVAAATLPLGVQRMGITDTMLITATGVALLGVVAALFVARLVPGARPRGNVRGHVRDRTEPSDVAFAVSVPLWAGWWRHNTWLRRTSRCSSSIGGT